MWHLYVIRAGDDRLYTGIATDVARRLAEHVAGAAKGAKSLRGKGPLRLVFAQPIGDRSLATKAEHRFKLLAKQDKERLVRSQPPAGRLLELLTLAGAEHDPR